MKWEDVTVEKVLIILILLLGAALRLVNLGQAPLSDSEAVLALQSLDLARGQAGEIGATVGAVVLTGLGFFLFGSSNFLARLLSASAGCLLVLAPVFFRHKLGRAAALLLMLGLAIDPGMVAMSRQVDSPMPALGFAALALGLAYQRRTLLAGIFAGLALLSGPAILVGALPFGLAWGLLQLLERPVAMVASPDSTASTAGRQLTDTGLRTLAIAAGVTVIVLGTLFFTVPESLSAWGALLPTYLRGWTEISRLPALRMAAALPVYHPLALIFGSIGAARGWLRRKRLERFLGLWFLLAFLLALIYPARQMGDLVWALTALWALAAIELGDILWVEAPPRSIALVQSLAIVLLLAMFWMNLTSTAQLLNDLQGWLMRLAMLAGLRVLGGVLTVLVAMGWSWNVARQGLVWGTCVGLGIYGVSVLASASQVRVPGQYELWQPVPRTANADLILLTMQNLSEWNQGLTKTLDVTLAVDAPSLQWLLRDYGALTLLPERQWGGIQGAPAVVIARLMDSTPKLTEAYRGQDFAWWESPAWQGALPPDFTRWLTTHQAPLWQDSVVLWARNDLFPDGELSSPILPEWQIIEPDEQ